MTPISSHSAAKEPHVNVVDKLDRKERLHRLGVWKDPAQHHAAAKNKSLRTRTAPKPPKPSKPPQSRLAPKQDTNPSDDEICEMVLTLVQNVVKARNEQMASRQLDELHILLDPGVPNSAFCPE